MGKRLHKGRGAVSTIEGRFDKRSIELDAEAEFEAAQVAPETQLRATPAGRIISSNNSPDVPFDRSINPYQGCELGCVYCYARPTHEMLGYSSDDIDRLLTAQDLATDDNGCSELVL